MNICCMKTSLDLLYDEFSRRDYIQLVKLNVLCVAMGGLSMGGRTKANIN